jgi:hypothetical protein
VNNGTKEEREREITKDEEKEISLCKRVSFVQYFHGFKLKWRGERKLNLPQLSSSSPLWQSSIRLHLSARGMQDPSWQANSLSGSQSRGTM